jgi:SAM-dependent methyltransferase
MDGISVFFSYSLSKTYDAILTEKVVDVAKERVEHRASLGWEVVDAMEPAVGLICEKVEDALKNSDALIAEATTWSPNVMYELGFARANKYPIVVLINRNALHEEMLAPYYDFLGISPTTPLPTDLGDIEFIDYSDDINLAGGLTNLEGSIDHALDVISARLPVGMRTLRRGERRLQAKTDRLGEATKDIVDPPLLRLLSGWLERVVTELGEAGSQGFLVSPKYYPACFAQFRDSERHAATAIADLSDETEPISVLANAGTNMGVSERIFLIGGQQFFDEVRLQFLFEEIHRFSEASDIPGNSILVARADDFDMPSIHPFPRARGQDLLLISPGLVGGYEVVDEQPYLNVVSDAETFEKAKIYYRNVRRCAFQFDSGWKDAIQMKSAWLAREKRVGRWKSGWTFNSRDSTYYDLYDLHIRTWVPGYEDFLETTASRVVQALLEAHSMPDTGAIPRAIMEIGCGTGNLTIRILRAVQRSRAASAVFKRLIAVDKAKEMTRSTVKTIKNSSLNESVVVSQGTAFTALEQEVLKAAPFGVICGSLVLSHLLQADVKTRLDYVLSECRELLVPGGSVVLVDALIPNPTERERLKKEWRQVMLLHGLPPERADLFLKHNQEMLNTATAEDLEASSSRNGFKLKIENIPAFGELPFRIISFQRD